MKAYTPQEYMDMIGEAISEVLKGEDCLVIFFGSVVRGDLRRTSDIDVGLYCREGLDPKLYLRIMDRIEDLPMLRKVDLIDLSAVKDPDFLENALEEGVVWKGSSDLLKDLKRHLESLRKS